VLHNDLLMVLTGDLAAGFCGGAVTDAVFYIADSHKTQSQAGRPLSLARMTRGLLPLSLTGSAPALAGWVMPIRTPGLCTWPPTKIGFGVSGVLDACHTPTQG
jgi:hypothetical protein